MTREAFHLFGLGCLFFKVMPYIDPLQTCVMTISISFLPSVIDFSSSMYQEEEEKRDVIYLCEQCFRCILIPGSFIATATTMVMSNDKRNIIQYPKQGELVIWSITSIVMISTRSIKTYYLFKNTISSNGTQNNICQNEGQQDDNNSENKQNKNDPTKKNSGSVIMHMFSSLLRIIFLLILFPTLFCPGIRGFNETFDLFLSFKNVSGFLPLNCTNISKDSNVSKRFDNIPVICNEEGVSFWLIMSAFLGHSAGTLLATHVGVLACRLTTQIYGFALPLIVATPLYTIIVIVVNETNVKFANDHLLLRSENKWLLIVFFVIGWVGQAHLCRHVFKNGETRLQLPRRLVTYLFSLYKKCDLS